MGKYLGEEGPTGTITYNPTSKLISWSTQGAESPNVYLEDPHRLFAGGASGVEPASWISLGTNYLFKLIDDATGTLLAWVNISADGSVTGQTIFGGEIPPEDETAPPGGSWFGDSTMMFGMEIPNVALLAGGGLLLMGFLKKGR